MAASADNYYDALIVGGGQAGIPLAYTLAAEGWSVALAEREQLGGSCVNFGCTPTKAAIASAKVAHTARRAGEFGVRVSGVSVDFAAVIERAAGISATSREGLESGFAGADNPRLLRGHARFTGKTDDGFTLDVGGTSVEARQVVIDTGSRTNVPPVEGLGEVEYLTAESWLSRTELPERLVILGGGYIGLEMAQFYRRMGSEVTVVIGSGDRVLAREDDEVSEAMRAILEDEGVGFLGGSRAERVERSGGELAVTLGDGREVRGTDLFVATGRSPNTDELGLEKIGLEAGKGGYIPVDERLRTEVEGVWAAGDVRGGPMFTHTAYDDFRVLASAMTSDGSHTTDRVVPYAVYTDPELGRAGMTEREAREAGREVEVLRFEMKNDGKSFEIGETKGFIKVIADARTEEILGCAVLASEGAELVHIYIDLMNAGAPTSVLRDAVHIHPTRAEAIQSAVS
ncbi:Pyruvate/2-oxoglutarate dehydrogenase complex dihydrolipoamide dehydrogenase (E3) component [Rubrobacter radiotolerans]|uniref:Mercuric reductase n=1 Tax=Rubrobacter radiotolerans TaxID=42256 RepID=A0A023X4J9_RUBRA|nr:mercuric reductase [Rubrobacter radiotolerans]AHY47273.1 Pyruvate/2-oxoglutarate dehydrogenase complex dihydrolipoamide dehydrogenase (E3) component [Rubrobacter radiotolerans]MDX5894678.1 mercuric reductase [Rubrobacter radiotolerans]SMC06522.1 Pyruvate/2-oxoglutarate dehydrogenase complex, dihydrolipoamide dehydrogenase (E3) component [Rubrobacter radiotolerans DSM 5868]